MGFNWTPFIFVAFHCCFPLRIFSPSTIGLCCIIWHKVINHDLEFVKYHVRLNVSGIRVWKSCNLILVHFVLNSNPNKLSGLCWFCWSLQFGAEMTVIQTRGKKTHSEEWRRNDQIKENYVSKWIKWRVFFSLSHDWSDFLWCLIEGREILQNKIIIFFMVKWFSLVFLSYFRFTFANFIFSLFFLSLIS